MGPQRIFFFAAAIALGATVLPALPRPAEAAGNASVQGAQVFATHSCTFCHGPRLMGTDRGPKILDVRKRLNAGQIAHQIHDGGKNMPPFGDQLTPQEIHALVAFLRSRHPDKLLPPAAPNPATL